VHVTCSRIFNGLMTAYILYILFQSYIGYAARSMFQYFSSPGVLDLSSMGPTEIEPINLKST
jgi:hypothetical protein